MKNSENNLIIGLDIGSSKICAAICEITSSEELNLRGIGKSIPAGINKGSITDPLELSKAIDRAISRASHNSNLKPTQIITNVPFNKIQSIHNMGFVLSKEVTGQISETEKIECIKRSKNIIKSPDQRVLHVIPISYKVDGNAISNPIGAFGGNLEVKSHIILGNSDNISNLNFAIKELNLQICGIVYDILSSSQILLTEKERKDGSILLDIGSKFTKIGIFKNNLLQDNLIIPIGGDTITADIAYCLKSSVPEAERIKILHGEAKSENISMEDKICINTKESGRKEIDKNLLCKIIEARVTELFKMIKSTLNYNYDNKYQVVLCGGSSSLPKIKEHVKSLFNAPIREGLPDEIQGIIENPEHSSAVGLIIYGLKIGAIKFPQKEKSSIFGKIKKKIKNIF
jgi:cell division protein FtsA